MNKESVKELSIKIVTQVYNQSNYYDAYELVEEILKQRYDKEKDNE